jgi:NTP pyrophosphatase (non-canonical NTP hydrolase)
MEKIQNRLKNFAQERDWEQFHNLKNLSAALSVEASELLEIFQWTSESELKNFMEKSNHRERVEEEVADVFLYLSRICDIAHIDLERVCLAKIQKNGLKYPVSLSKGKSSKYSDL